MVASCSLITLLTFLALTAKCDTDQRAKSISEAVLDGSTTFLKEFLKASEKLFPLSNNRNVSKNNIQYDTRKLKHNKLNSGVFKRKVSDRNAHTFNHVTTTTAQPTVNFSLNDLDQATRIFIRSILKNSNKKADSRLLDNELPRGSRKKSSNSLDAKISVEEIPKIVRDSHSSDTNVSDGDSKTSFLGLLIKTLTDLPIIGNVLRASVDPLYRPIVESFQSQTRSGEISPDENKSAKDWCFGGLGCLPLTDDFFHPLYRPVNLPPYKREDIKVIFTIHNKYDPAGYSFPAVNITDIRNSSFARNVPLKIIIHGFLHDRHQTWVWEMVRGFLIHGEYNVITVDWSKGSRALYSQATANSRVVAMEVVTLIAWLIYNYEVMPSQVHILGHSLGAHTAGYVGKSIAGLQRITGLDPAEPYFQYMPSTVRLDASDAKFVDVIHTDIDSFFAITGPRGFGLQQPIGHVDFYPNGGHEQPGCNQLLTRVPLTMMLEGQDFAEGINAAQTDLVQCDHIRSAKLFTDSLVSKCPFLGYVCDTYKLYRDGQCFDCGLNGESCLAMGINAEKWKRSNETNMKVFLDTNTSPSFCLYHYVLQLKTNDHLLSSGYIRGRIKITLISNDGSLMEFDLTSLAPIKFPRKGSRTFLLETIEDLTGTSEALVSWTYESDLLDPLTFCIIFCRADLHIASATLQSIDTPEMAARAFQFQQESTSGKNLLHPPLVKMCHSGGKPTVTIPNGSTIKISATPGCHHPIGQNLVATDKIQ